MFLRLTCIVKGASFGLVADDDASCSQPWKGGSVRRFGAHLARGGNPWSSRPTPNFSQALKGDRFQGLAPLAMRASALCRPFRASNAHHCPGSDNPKLETSAGCCFRRSRDISFPRLLFLFWDFSQNLSTDPSCPYSRRSFWALFRVSANFSRSVPQPT